VIVIIDGRLPGSLNRPWGNSVARNITQNTGKGTGRWTDAQIRHRITKASAATATISSLRWESTLAPRQVPDVDSASDAVC